jgi:glycine/D-amino acid oxidase-like deaminating enzyme
MRKSKSDPISDVVVIGGGAVGSASAYLLSKEGISVTLVLGSAVGKTASWFAAGLLSPLIETIHNQDPLKSLSIQGFDLHQTLAPELLEITGLDYQAERQDSIYLSSTQQVTTSLETLMTLSKQIEGISGQWLDQNDLRSLDPRIKSTYPESLLINGTWLLDAYGYTNALMEGARKKGARVINGSVSSINKSGSSFEIMVDENCVHAEKIVLAMGPWTNTAREWLDIPAAVSPLKGQILRIELSGPHLGYSIHKGSNYIVSKPSGLVWAGTTEEHVGFSDNPTTEGRKSIISNVSSFFPSISAGLVRDQTACLRPVTPDGRPILGKTLMSDGIYLATGAGRKGILLSPSMAKIICQLITNNQTSVDIDSFSPDRFN